MSKSQLNLQDSFLNQVRKENIPVVLYLTSGVQLRGHVKGFDAFTVILEGQGKPPLGRKVYFAVCGLLTPRKA